MGPAERTCPVPVAGHRGPRTRSSPAPRSPGPRGHPATAPDTLRWMGQELADRLRAAVDPLPPPGTAPAPGVSAAVLLLADPPHRAAAARIRRRSPRSVTQGSTPRCVPESLRGREVSHPHRDLR